MIGFKTKSSIYYVNTQNKTIWGGKLGDRPRQYMQCSAIIGTQAKVWFPNGDIMTTGVVEKYI